MRITVFSLIALVLFVAAPVSAQQRVRIMKASDSVRPSWVRGGVDNVSPAGSYRFAVVEDMGPSLEGLLNNRSSNLANYIQSTRQIEGVQNRNISSRKTDEGASVSSNYTISFDARTSTSTFECIMIDNYWEYLNVSGVGGKQYRLYTCYAISDPGMGTVIFDNFQVTTNYGTQGLWRSAIAPGWGQMYKGLYVKGGLIMGGTVAFAGGIIVSETLRSAYSVKASTTHFTTAAKQYQAYISNATTARNICIGGVAALYIYNLIDAVAAPGARRIVVTPAVYGNGAYGIGSRIDF